MLVSSIWHVWLWLLISTKPNNTKRYGEARRCLRQGISRIGTRRTSVCERLVVGQTWIGRFGVCRVPPSCSFTVRNEGKQFLGSRSVQPRSEQRCTRYTLAVRRLLDSAICCPHLSSGPHRRHQVNATPPLFALVSRPTVPGPILPDPTRPNQELFPVFVLNIECPRKEVDIMVDPEKTWVEFSDWTAARNACVAMLLVSRPRRRFPRPGNFRAQRDASSSSSVFVFGVACARVDGEGNRHRLHHSC